MGSPRRSISPEYAFDKDEVKPLVIDYGFTNRFRPGQVVFLRILTQLEGPYKIEAHAGVRQYTLCFSNGQQARNGEIVVEENLTEQNTAGST